MGYGIINMGQQTKNLAIDSFGELARQEQQRNMANDQIQRAQDAQDANMIGTGAGMGLQADLEAGRLGSEAWANTFGNGTPQTTQAINANTGLVNGPAHSPIQTQIGNSGVYTQPMTTPTAIAEAQQGVSAVADVAQGANVAKDAATGVNAVKDVATGVNAVKDVAAGANAINAATGAATATQATTAAVGAGAATAEGASAGASFGPWGALAGAAVGFLISQIF
ncbi:hypothetical protein KUW19_00900 [Ferrimonas balearica]|uniref:hypothetical protein n=1 Tax=Ferrimonas balearica TaxID=44012 RepID=UPI001C97BA5B|nr:hypothetical protein [Ferrimonas balearica]MBY6105035.1 hypothetical protein [Ferrimonas balearica]